jgi:hypothetical protein
MATKQESPQKDNWLNELEMLVVNPKVRNELNDIQGTSKLAENLKQIFYQAYKEAFRDSNNDDNKNLQDFQMALT